MSKIKPALKFKGLMAPVFTPFKNDGLKSLDTSVIDEYAKYLKQKNITGVLANGSTGEGPVLNVTERKSVAEAWSKASKKYGLTLMVQIGGAPLVDVIELAKHAESLKVDAVLCLPELYFKPKTVDDLVGYFKQIASHCPKTPFLYYHIPMYTGITLHIPTFCDLAEKEISNFVGLKYTSGDLEQGVDLLKPGRNVFLGADTILSGALVLGFDSAIMTSLNNCPELAQKIVNAVEKGDFKEAKTLQNSLRSWIKSVLKEYGGEWVKSMKSDFNKTVKINVGSVRSITV